MTQNDIRRLAEESRRTHMNFVWSVHPAMQNGVDLSSRETVDQGVEAVLRKYRHLYLSLIHIFHDTLCDEP